MKKLIAAIITIILCLSFVGCTAKGPIKLGLYRQLGHISGEVANTLAVNLKENNKFVIEARVGISIDAKETDDKTGTYTVKDEILTLTTNSNKVFIFKIENDNIIFQEKGSCSDPFYSNEQSVSTLYQGDKLLFTDKEPNIKYVIK